MQAVERTSISSVNRSSGVRSEPWSATAATLIPSAVAKMTPTLRGSTDHHGCQGVRVSKGVRLGLTV